MYVLFNLAGNIAGDSPQCRDFVLEAGVISPLLK